MTYEVFFNRPNKPIPVYRLREDMRRATHRLVLASAWFTDDETAMAFVESRAASKLGLLSRADMQRKDNGTSVNAVDILKTAAGASLAIIGTGDFRTGTMHHKFVVADDVVWFGSYNLTYQAKKNYETLIRVESPELADRFAAEANDVASQGVPAAAKPLRRIEAENPDLRIVFKTIDSFEPSPTIGSKVNPKAAFWCDDCGDFGHATSDHLTVCDYCGGDKMNGVAYGSHGCYCAGQWCSSCQSIKREFAGPSTSCCECDKEQSPCQFHEGDRVRHKTFGDGVVLDSNWFVGHKELAEDVTVLFANYPMPQLIILSEFSLDSLEMIEKVAR